MAYVKKIDIPPKQIQIALKRDRVELITQQYVNKIKKYYHRAFV